MGTWQSRVGVLAASVLLCTTSVALVAEPPPPRAGYAYKGRQVTAAWVDQQYAYFKDKIACVDGKFYDVGKALLVRPAVTREPPALGEARVPCNIADLRGRDAQAVVLQLVGRDQAIVTRPARAPIGVLLPSGQDEVLFHVRGIDPKKHIDGTFFNEMLVYVGTYEYVNTMGANRTVQSFTVYQPIAREQFVEALADGFQLVRYKKVTKKVPENRGFATDGFSVRPGRTVMVDKEEVVAQPVPPPAGAPAVEAPPEKGD